MKNKIKTKASAIKTHAIGTGGGPPIKPLNDFEERVAQLIGHEAIEGLTTVEAGFGETENVIQESSSFRIFTIPPDISPVVRR